MKDALQGRRESPSTKPASPHERVRYIAPRLVKRERLARIAALTKSSGISTDGA